MVYSYTKPRGAIMAMHSGPGPAYGLPGMVGQAGHDPRSVHHKNPSYSFGIRHGKMVDDCSPGPSYLPSPKILRYGKDGTPHYSLYSRPRDVRPFSNPGPGAYSPQHVGPQAYLRHPAYSFGSRNRLRRSDDAPAPNAYSLDNMMGKTIRSGKSQAPIFTMRPRYTLGAFYEDLAKTPGPGTYMTTGPDTYNNKGRAPLYSMTGRNSMPGDSAQKPGPGAHRPEQVVINKPSAPAPSFGIRHSSYLAPLIIDPIS